MVLLPFLSVDSIFYASICTEFCDSYVLYQITSPELLLSFHIVHNCQKKKSDRNLWSDSCDEFHGFIEESSVYACISVNTYISEYMSVFLCGAGWTLRSPFRWWQPWPYNWSSVSSNCRPRPPSQSQWGRRRLHQPHPPRPRKATNLSGDRSGIYSKTCLSDCLFCRSCIYI